ncbi:hypothetical protein B566_EDAN011301 [Ephemera danica]|nr:hypothetical protein B566_EDAN011301 [Ephemera danica]
MELYINYARCRKEELGSLKDISNSLAVFCLATYGEGDPTDNAQEFNEWLQNGDVDLTGLNYSVFGLGNKTYEHYNAMANIEDDFITWKDRFWPAVCEYFGIEAMGEDVSVRQYRLTVHEEVNREKIYTGEVARIHSLKNQRPPYDAKNPYLAPVVVNRELHKSGGRSCMHIELNIDGSKIRYDAGDHVAVYPINDESLVNRIGELLGVDLETVITLTNTDEDSTKKHPFPCPCSYRTALLYYVDITANPRTHIIKELIEYTTDEKEKEQLRLMASTSVEGKQLYTDWVIQSNRNIVHILEDLPSCKPALDHLCELLPRLQARYYSISSSSKYETTTKRINKGVATSWLAEKQPTADNFPTVPIFVRRSQFRLPTRPQTPVLMIGPGTGIAPFRGFIQERDQAKADGKVVGDTILYFGCRKKAEDFIYEEELEEYIKRGVLKMYTAFSRDQEQKVYVTHLLRQNADEVCFLEKDSLMIGDSGIFLFSSLQMVMDASDAAASAAEAAGVVEEAAMFGVLDIFVLTAILGAGVWWLWRNFRPTPPPPPPSTYMQSPNMFTSQTSMDTSFIKKLRSSGRSLVVFYGSQTGTAEEFAGRLAKEGMRYQLKGMVADPEECEMVSPVSKKGNFLW